MTNILSNLNPVQQQAVQDTEGRILVLAGAGSGKALANNTAVKTPNGEITIGNIKIGQEIINTSGGISKVLGVYPQGEKEVWKVHFSNETTIEACSEHLWTVKLVGEENPVTLTTEQLSTVKIFTENEEGLYEPNIKLPEVIPFNSSATLEDFNPYSYGTMVGLGLSEKDLPYIPEEIMYGSIFTKVEFFKGLFDSSLVFSKGFYIYKGELDLIAELHELASSLSLYSFVQIYEKESTLYIQPSKSIGSLHTESFLGFEIQEFHDSFLHITKIEKQNYSKEMTCIEVDSEDKLFLIDGFIPTHNTSVLAARAAYLVQNSVPAWQILCITFTNKASKEMKSRINRISNGNAKDAWVGTFHSTCLRILTRFSSEIGYEKFTLIDDSDQKQIVKEINKTLGYEYDHKDVLSAISSWKTEMNQPGELIASLKFKEDIEKAHIYQAYEDKKRELNYFDFDDLINNVVTLFKTRPDIAHIYQKQFRYVLIDEFQDTNRIQFELIDLLTAHHQNVFLVG